MDDKEYNGIKSMLNSTDKTSIEYALCFLNGKDKQDFPYIILLYKLQKYHDDPSFSIASEYAKMKLWENNAPKICAWFKKHGITDPSHLTNDKIIKIAKQHNIDLQFVFDEIKNLN